MRIFLWHVHGSWTTAFVQGGHQYFVPVLPDRGPDGRGRAQTWDWPASVVEVDPGQARDLEVDAILLQRPVELERLAGDWLGREPGSIPTVYVEHNSPQGRIAEMAHPARDRGDLTVVHVTHFNRLFWDTGSTRAVVVEHGVVDPGYRYTGELGHAAAVVNEPVRRGRVTGTDLLDRFRSRVPIDLFGMGTEPVGGLGNLSQDELHTEVGRRRVYLHPYRWTSLGLALIEAMHLGMPIVGVAATEVGEAVPPEAGIVSTDQELLADALRRLVDDPEEAHARGKAARSHALERFGLARFLADWELVLREVAAG